MVAGGVSRAAWATPALNAAVEHSADATTARMVLETDDMVDGLNRSTIREAIQLVKSNTITLEASLELMRIARNLERIGDLSTNIAEEVIFHVQAKVIKHGDDQK